ncbi:MAG: ATP-dependent ligase [Naasia sp.]|jgi:hypothetical protein|uniref:DUF7882 family protein n=1 Tax=Naasia sp. TaxID=2546198 RepID=UPI00260585E4|nr:hypothetical protein [Naasia sp.]MCU1571851.1 ATP-dependent ligase [Naasia sp.]
MGSIRYGTYPLLEIDDRVLAHIKAAVLAKLRRDESFAFTWVRSEQRGGGRETVWVHPAIPFVFTFDSSAPEPLNRAWVEALVEGANSPGGMQVVPEPHREHA